MDNAPGLAPYRAIGRRGLFAVLLGLAGALAGSLAHAEFPDGKPIRIVVGFGPGTGSDLQARAVADAMSRELAAPVIVDNRPGAAGMIGAMAVTTAAPDGYTLAFGTTTSMVTLPLLSRNAKYDALRDFTPIATLGKAPFLVMVANKPDGPATLRDLLARTKARSLSFGSIGNGSFGHLATARLLQATGSTAIHVPYKSSPQELQDLAAGSLDFAIDSTTAGLPLVRNGLLRALAVTSASRLASMPDVPTVAETIGQDFEHTVWTGLLAPAHTPDAVVAKLSKAVAAALKSSDLQARTASMELQPFALDAAGFEAYLRTEVPAWRAFLLRADIRIDE
ncbi:MAG: tripartite tricarboxylate transporter substrate binding protein [Variovorax sp.]|nr:tripartite tricarboxylate transporter substrate binding protein [Variovorax sp.]